MAEFERNALETSTSECYIRYSRSLINFLKGYVRCVYLAEEIVQDVFLKLFDKGIILDPDVSHTRNFLFSVAKNAALDHLRRRDTERRRYNDIYMEEVQCNNLFYNSLEKMVIKGEVIDTLYDTINSLPQEKRAVAIKKLFLQEKSREIAEELNISVFILNKIIREVKSTLRLKLKEYFMDDLS